jgi:hypothetical protein
MKNTLWLYKDSYQIEIREKEAHPPQVAVYLYKTEEEIKSIVLTGGGSVSSLWEKSALLDGDRLLITCGNEVYCLLLPTIKVCWHTQVDMATCFEIVPYQDDYITHGEVEISRLNRQGEILWQFSGKDIFVSPTERIPSFTLTSKGIELIDFNYESYLIDYQGKII